MVDPKEVAIETAMGLQGIQMQLGDQTLDELIVVVMSIILQVAREMLINMA